MASLINRQKSTQRTALKAFKINIKVNIRCFLTQINCFMCIPLKDKTRLNIILDHWSKLVNIHQTNNIPNRSICLFIVITGIFLFLFWLLVYLDFFTFIMILHDLYVHVDVYVETETIEMNWVAFTMLRLINR